MSIILLEHPRPRNPKRSEDVVNAPLSSCLITDYIASVLKSKCLELEVINANLCGWSLHKTTSELKKKNFSLLGVHLVYLWENTEDIFEMLLNLRKNDVSAHINLYGHFPTFAFKEILMNYPFINSITIGEPEITFLELAETVINCKGNSALYSIEGLAFNSLSNETKGKFLDGSPANSSSYPFIKKDRSALSSSFVSSFNTDVSLEKQDVINTKIDKGIFGVNIIKNKPRKPVSNLDDLPFPLRSGSDLLKEKGIATYILASRGCYGKCTFCYINQFYGERAYWRERSPENVFDEIYHIYKNLGERYFYFADANFYGPGRKGKERACQLANLIIDKGLKIIFGIECRANDIEEESVGKLVKAGLRDVFLGIESGNQNTLDRFKKLTKVEDNKRAISILRSYGIELNYGFIMFEPGSTLADVRENFEFLKEMKMLTTPSVTAHLLYHRKTIFKGMPDYKEIQGIAKPVSKFNHENSYEFRDKKVGDLSEKISAFCLKVLQDLSRNRDSGKREHYTCSYDENDLFSRDINKKLIEHFEKTLHSYECT